MYVLQVLDESRFWWRVAIHGLIGLIVFMGPGFSLADKVGLGLLLSVMCFIVHAMYLKWGWSDSPWPRMPRGFWWATSPLMVICTILVVAALHVLQPY